MAFKHKKKIAEILAMSFEEYAKFLKKEINRAAKLGQLDAVVCSQHAFADGKESALVLMGVYTGELAKFFKENKAKKEFAKGTCFFEQTDAGVTMHIALNAGKGKPDKVQKGGKKLWSKLGIDSKFYAGELPNLDASLDAVNVGEEELTATVDAANDEQKIGVVVKQYKQAKKLLQQEVVPFITDKATKDTDYTNQHFKIAKKALASAISVIDKVEELDENKQVTYQKILAAAQKDQPQLKRIAAKIKKALMATNEVDIEIDDQLSDAEQAKKMQLSLEELDQVFTKLDGLKVKALEAIKFLKTQ